MDSCREFHDTAFLARVKKTRTPVSRKWLDGWAEHFIHVIISSSQFMFCKIFYTIPSTFVCSQQMIKTVKGFDGLIVS